MRRSIESYSPGEEWEHIEVLDSLEAEYGDLLPRTIGQREIKKSNRAYFDTLGVRHDRTSDSLGIERNANGD